MDIITEEFAQAVMAAVEERAGRPVVIEHVLKNNGVRLNGLCIRNEGGSGVSPTFYLESIKPEYRSAEYIESLARQIMEAIDCHRHGIDETVPDQISRLLSDADEVKRRILPRVVSFWWNTEMLRTMPYSRFLDLAVTFEIEVGENSTMRVRSGMMEMIALSVDEMYEAAMRNARLKGYSVMRIGDIVERSLRDSGFRPVARASGAGGAGEVATGTESAGRAYGAGAVDLGVDFASAPMVVISNRACLNGAYGMLDEELLGRVADGFTVQTDEGEKAGIDAMYIIPSSVHEIIATPTSWGTGTEAGIDYIREMVKAVNETFAIVGEQIEDGLLFIE